MSARKTYHSKERKNEKYSFNMQQKHRERKKYR